MLRAAIRATKKSGPSERKAVDKLPR
jgi:hypothetical protein